MNGEGELKEQRAEIVLYRDGCPSCDEAAKELAALARRYGALLDARRVDTDLHLEGYPSWRTPIVYVNGKEVSHYQVNPRRWEQALQENERVAPSKIVGEIVDIHCYMGTKAKGERHKECAEECVKAGQPIGLVTKSGELYLLLRDNACLEAYEGLKSLSAEQVRITGDIRERGGVQSITVRNVEAATGGGLI